MSTFYKVLAVVCGPLMVFCIFDRNLPFATFFLIQYVGYQILAKLYEGGES